jgi:hypothetical protein
MTRHSTYTVIPIFQPSGGMDFIPFTVFCGISGIIIYTLVANRFRIELRGKNLYIAQTGSLNTYNHRLIHYNVESLPVILTKHGKYDLEYLNNKSIACIDDKTDISKFISDCKKNNSHTVIEYNKISLFTFDKICQKKIYWKDIKKIDILE